MLMDHGLICPPRLPDAGWKQPIETGRESSRQRRGIDTFHRAATEPPIPPSCKQTLLSPDQSGTLTMFDYKLVTNRRPSGLDSQLILLRLTLSSALLRISGA